MHGVHLAALGDRPGDSLSVYDEALLVGSRRVGEVVAPVDLEQRPLRRPTGVDEIHVGELTRASCQHHRALVTGDGSARGLVG